MSQYVARRGDVTIVVDDWMPQIRAALDDAGRAILDGVERETEDIFQTARRLWPVGTRDHQRSRDTLARQVRLDGDGTVRGQVRAGAVYARFITSAQIASGPVPDRDDYEQQIHRTASISRTDHPTEAQATRGYRDLLSRKLAAAAHARELGKANTRAGRNGSAMWLLLRWPERRAGDRLTEELGPIIEAELARRLEG